MLYKVTGAGHSVCVCVCVWVVVVVGEGGQSSVVRGVSEGRGGGKDGREFSFLTA